MSAYPFHAISNSDIQFFTELLGPNALFNQEQRVNYGHDETEDLSFPPSAVLRPGTPEEISKIMANKFYCVRTDPKGDANCPILADGSRGRLDIIHVPG